jgi:short subunit fatty acids transporter
MLMIVLFALAPLVVFIVLAMMDNRVPRETPPRCRDMGLNLVSFAMQGAVVPAFGYAIAEAALPNFGRREQTFYVLVSLARSC